MSDPVETAAAALAAEPGYAACSPADKRTSAILALMEAGGDIEDDLAVALVVEYADLRAAAPLARGYDYDADPAAYDEVAALVAGKPAEPAPARPAAKVAAAPAKAATAQPVTILGRFREATGMTFPEIAETLGEISRSSVQAIIAGRMKEQLLPEDRQSLAAVLNDRKRQIEALLADLAG
jgi:hypothetical protein